MKLPRQISPLLNYTQINKYKILIQVEAAKKQLKNETYFKNAFLAGQIGALRCSSTDAKSEITKKWMKEGGELPVDTI